MVMNLLMIMIETIVMIDDGFNDDEIRRQAIQLNG